jgi:hypothetical protein
MTGGERDPLGAEGLALRHDDARYRSSAHGVKLTPANAAQRRTESTGDVTRVTVVTHYERGVGSIRGGG